MLVPCDDVLDVRPGVGRVVDVAVEACDAADVDRLAARSRDDRARVVALFRVLHRAKLVFHIVASIVAIDVIVGSIVPPVLISQMHLAVCRQLQLGRSLCRQRA